MSVRTRRTFLTREEIRQRLGKAIKASGLSLRNWSIANGISNSHVSAAMIGKDPPGPKIMRALGIDPEPRFALLPRGAKPVGERAPERLARDDEPPLPLGPAE